MNSFSKDSIEFLKNLQANNNREWFQASKKHYEAVIKKPAIDVSSALNEQVEKLTGTRHTTKIFKIHRDVRFSKDKTPYHTHIHMAFTPDSDRQIRPMWFFGLDTQKLVMGAGVFEFHRDYLDVWRERVAGDDGEELLKLLAKLEMHGARTDEPALKRVPKPWPADHPRENLLRRKGFTIWLDAPDKASAFGDEAVSFCTNEFRKLLPLVKWMSN